MKRIWLLACTSCLMGVPPALSYEIGTHADISRAAVEFSVLNQPSLGVLSDLGLEESISVREQFPDSANVRSSISQLFQTGARVEDNFLRPRHHFYDSINNRPLTVFGLAIGRTSPDWALEDNGQLTGAFEGPQRFSFADARQYMLQALTSTSENDRKANFGLMFQTLGQVIHHIQDMAQPQHVRNDAHFRQPIVRRFNVAQLDSL